MRTVSLVFLKDVWFPSNIKCSLAFVIWVFKEAKDRAILRRVFFISSLLHYWWQRFADLMQLRCPEGY
jgi:hypothetical protein